MYKRQNVYSYDDLLNCSNYSNTGEIIVLRKSFESLEDVYKRQILYQSYATSQINEIQSGKKDLELIDEVIYERQEKIKKRKMVTKIVKSICF